MSWAAMLFFWELPRLPDALRRAALLRAAPCLAAACPAVPVFLFRLGLFAVKNSTSARARDAHCYHTRAPAKYKPLGRNFTHFSQTRAPQLVALARKLADAHFALVGNVVCAGN